MSNPTRRGILNVLKEWRASAAPIQTERECKDRFLWKSGVGVAEDVLEVQPQQLFGGTYGS